MKWIFLALNAAKLGPALWSSLSIFLSIWTYALFFGWPFAAGFVALIFVHELGHYIAARDRGLDVGLPIFLPFVGAWIALKEQPINAETEAYIAYAGPFIGTLGAFACYYMGKATGDPFWLALAKSGFVLNLFNMIPVSPLDGGAVLRHFFRMFLRDRTAFVISVWIGMVAGVLVAIAGLIFRSVFLAFLMAWYVFMNFQQWQYFRKNGYPGD